MSINLLDTVKQYITPGIITKASAQLGEDETAIRKALSGVVPSIFSVIISKSSIEDAAGATEVFNIAKENYNSGVLENPGSLFTDGGLLNMGARMLEGLFGEKLNAIVDSIASYSGVRNSSVNSLFSLAAPVAMATVGKHAVEHNLDTAGLATFLSGQMSNVTNILPAGLSGITAMFGFGRTDESTPAIPGTREPVTKRDLTMRWLLLLIVVVLGGLAVWYFI